MFKVGDIVQITKSIQNDWGEISVYDVMNPRHSHSEELLKMMKVIGFDYLDEYYNIDLAELDSPKEYWSSYNEEELTLIKGG